MAKRENQKKAKIAKVKKENYFKGVKKELELVKWPSVFEVVKNSIATVVLCVFICGFFILLDLFLAALKGWFV